MTPIRQENKHLYPADWQGIRAEILERAGHCCESCGVANYTTVTRGDREVRIVLTISHTDHDPTNNGVRGNRPNLKALCQRCHNRWDMEHRKETRYRTRRAAQNRAGQRDLFGEAK